MANLRLNMPGLHCLAILYPKPGKTQQVLALLRPVIAQSLFNEPGTLRYEIRYEPSPEDGGSEHIVAIERYRDEAALSVHNGAELFKSFFKKCEEQGLMEKPMTIMWLSEGEGFMSK